YFARQSVCGALTPFFCVRQDYEELEKQLKEVFKERSTVLRQLTKTSGELDGIKVNLQSLKNDEQSSKTDVQKLLELGQKQREEMKSLQEALQNQLKETSEKAEKHQATAQQLTELEQKLAVAKNELEKAALDRSQKSSPGNHESSQVQSTKEETRRTSVCGPQDEGSPCLVKHEEGPQRNLTSESEPATQKLQMSPCPECEEKTDPEKQPAGFDGTPAREEKLL
ncbi:Leucine zipper protein 2, partial [Microtus ochrogaster]